MISKQKFFLSIIPVLMLIFTFFSVSAQGQTPEKLKDGGSLKMAVSLAFDSLDARYIPSSGGSTRGQQLLYNRPVEYGPEGVHDTIPALATDWKKLDDVTWLVDLRKGVKFHNGKELTAEDVARNFDWRIHSRKNIEKGMKPPRGRSSYMQIKNVEAMDKYTLKFTLKFPFVPFVEMNLGWGCRGIIDPDIVDKFGKQATLHPVGTGPFKFERHVSGSHLILKRFEDYWAGKPYLDEVIIRIIPDPQTRLIALQRGEVDIATDIPFNQIRTIQNDPDLKYHVVIDPMTSCWGNLGFNLRRWPMNQLKFRQAVAMGADWKYFAKVVFPKDMAPIRHTFFDRSSLANKEGKDLVPSFNPDKARRLLKEVQQEAGKPIPRIYAMTTKAKQGLPASVLRIGAEELKKIGLYLDVHILEAEVYKNIFRRDPNSSWDIRIGSFDGPAFEPSKTFADFYSKNPNAGDGKNINAYNNPKMDELYLKVNSVDNKEERKKIFQDMEQILLKDLVVMPIFDIPYIYAYNKRVHDFPAHQSAHPFLRTTWNNVWLEKEE